MRSHPITLERISDMQNRLQDSPYRQVRDSLDYQLVRAKLRAQIGTPKEAVAEFELQLRERKFTSEASARYGLAFAHLRAGDHAAAGREIEALRRLQKGSEDSPMIESLAARTKLAAADPTAAAALFRDALQRFPTARALAYGYADALFSLHDHKRLDSFLDEQLLSWSSDPKLYEMRARLRATQGRKLQQHRALAEMYVLQGRLPLAIEQLQLARRAGDGDFYDQSVVDARLRELQKQQAEEAKQKN